MGIKKSQVTLILNEKYYLTEKNIFLTHPPYTDFFRVEIINS